MDGVVLTVCLGVEAVLGHGLVVEQGVVAVFDQPDLAVGQGMVVVLGLAVEQVVVTGLDVCQCLFCCVELGLVLQQIQL